LLTQRKAKKVGTTIKAKVLEIDMRKERLVLSATAAAAELEEQRLESLEQGSVVTGRVVNLVSFGAFVDLGGIQGLIHISNITWEKIDHPSEALDIGEEVEVLIEKVDLDRKRINLNRKEVLPNPWQQVAEKYEVGDLVEGTVTNTTDFGIFVALPIGVEGLVHESEILDYQRDALKSGDEVLVRIIRIQADQGRIGLSLKEVTLDEELEWMAQRRREEQEAILEEQGEFDDFEDSYQEEE
jgi:ribosomal protein S1